MTPTLPLPSPLPPPESTVSLVLPHAVSARAAQTAAAVAPIAREAFRPFLYRTVLPAIYRLLIERDQA